MSEALGDVNGADALPLPEADDATRPVFDMFPLDEFLEQESPPMEWLLPELVPAHCVTVIFGPPGAGKTLFAFDLAAQVAARGKRVMVIEQEGPKRACQDRLRRAAEAAGLDRDGMHRIDVTWNTRLSLLDYKTHRYMVELAGVKRAELVVLDSIAALSAGIDENAPEFSAVGEALHDLKDAGCAVVAIGHPKKDAWKPDYLPRLEDLRGHGSLGGRIDSALALVPADDVAGLVRFKLYLVKQRDGERVPPRQVEVLMTGPAAVVTHEPIEGKAPPRPQSKSEAQLAAMMKEVLEKAPVGEENAVSCNTIAGEIRKHKPTILRAIKELTLLPNAELRQLPDQRVYRMKVQRPSDSGRFDRYSRSKASGDE